MRKILKDERGISSIVISISIVIVVTLIVMGFAAIMRRENRQALDRQLSSQAQYAAETALNEAAAEINADPSAVTAVTTCPAAEPTFDDMHDVIRTTCVLIDPQPDSLEFDVGTTSTVRLLKPTAPVANLDINWSGGENCLTTTHNQLPQSLGPNDITMLRLDLTKVGNIDRQAMIDNTFSAVLYPYASSSNTHFTRNFTNNSSVFGRCNNSTDIAEARIAIGQSAAEPLLMRIRGIYKSSSITVTGMDSHGNAIEFTETQALVDATARVNDIVRRVQARVPIGPRSGDYPDFAVRTSEDLCKLLQTAPLPLSTTDGC